MYCLKFSCRLFLMGIACTVLPLLSVFTNTVDAQPADKITSSVSQKLDEYLTSAQQQHQFNGTALVAKQGKILLHKGYGWHEKGYDFELERIKKTTGGIPDFEQKLERLRERYHIPGFSAGVVQGGKLIWKKGFGYADLQNKTVPDEHTVYQIASITKTFGAIILMQLVEKGKVSLDDPISKYDIHLGARWGSDERIKVKHLLTHSAAGNTFNGFKAGYSFRYNGAWYNQLEKVIEKASGRRFGELLMENIIVPLGLENTVPSIDDSVNFELSGYDRNAFLKRIAKPYDWKDKQLQPVQMKYNFGPAAGLMSTVSDLAAYSAAIDEGKFLEPLTWEKVFSPFVTPNGKTLPYGLGWFVKYYKGVKMIWHTGWWTGYSALLIKIPEKELTFIILANSQDLSRPFYHVVRPLPGIGFLHPLRSNLNKDLFASGFAEAFIDHFVRM